MAKGHPFLVSIGDWVIVGGPRFFGDKNPASPYEVVEVTGIIESEPGRYDIHVAGAVKNEPVQDYYLLHQIDITDETLQDFGFEPCNEHDYTYFLFDTHCYRLDCSEIECPDLGYFYISWQEDCDGYRTYRIVCRGYGEIMELLEDTISELQHFFFRYNSEYPMPLKYHGHSHFKPAKRYHP